MKHRYIVGGGVLYDGSTFIPDGAILVDNGAVAAIGPTEPIRAHHDASFLDVGGRLVLPGLLDAHTHLYSALSAGLEPTGPMDSFPHILENLWWRLDAVHDEESIYYSAMTGIIDHIKAGVTTLFDHHASMECAAGSLEIIASAFREAGVRGTLCFEISERTGRDAVADQIEENIEFYESHNSDSFVRGTMGLHANLTLSGETLSEIADARPSGMPIHVHVGEAAQDLSLCEHDGYEGPVDRLHRYGLLDRNSIVVHALHLSKRDAAVLREVRPIIVLAAESNANNGVGHINPAMIDRYLLGTDGMTPDMIEALRYHVLLLHSLHSDDSTATDAFFGYRGEVQQRFFPSTGDFTVGSRADIAVLDYAPLTPVTARNIVSHLVYGARQGHAFLTIADGRILYQNGTLTFMDEAQFRSHARRAARKLHERFYG